MGIEADDSSGRVVLTHVAPNGPATGHLQVGDELIRVTDPDRTWESPADLKNGLWGQGIIGSPLTVTLRRDGKVIYIHLERGPVEGRKVKVSSMIELWQHEMDVTWPDFKVEIKMLFEKDDLVACYTVNGGTNQHHHKGALWGELDILRLKDGKIIDIWAIEDRYSMLKQLGFTITEPVKEPA